MNQGNVTAGHPVNVATGVVYLTHKEIYIPGKVNLSWGRHYSTNLLEAPTNNFGPGWTNRYFATLTQFEKEFKFLSPEGEIEIFADPQNKIDNGGIVRNLGTYQELSKQGNRLIVTRWDTDTDSIERYVFERGELGIVRPLASIEDLSGQGLDVKRDPSGRIIAIQQRLENRSLQIGYNSKNKITSVSFSTPGRPKKVLVRYEYDKQGNLSAAYNAFDDADLYEYDANSRITREIIKDGGVFDFRYDEKGRCIETTGLNDYDKKTLWYLDSGWTKVTNSTGQVTLYQWMPSGQIITEVNPLGGTRKTEYDDFGRIRSKTDENGFSKHFEYDEQGNRYKTINSLGYEYLLTFNDSHQPLSFTNPAGGIWRRKYDDSNRLVESEDPAGGRWILSYDGDGNIVSLNINGSIIRQSFSSNGLMKEATDPAGHVTRYSFDEFGRVTERTDSLGNKTKYFYDILGNLSAVIRPDDSQINYQYDSAGNLIKFTDRNGQTIHYHYGPCKRLLKIVNSVGDLVKLEWGSEPWQLLKIKNSKDEEFCFEYDAVGNLLKETSFDGLIISYEYDQVGNRIARINGNGDRVTYKFDMLGRTKEIVLPDENKAVYEYDKGSNVIYAGNSDVEIKYERDVLGRITNEKQGNFSIDYKYSTSGNLIQTITSLSHQIDYRFDQRHLLLSVQVDKTHNFQFLRDPIGHEIERVLPGSASLLQTVDNVGRLLEQHVIRGTHKSGAKGRSIIHRSYDWENSLVTGIQDGFWGMTNYIYDALENLIKSVHENDDNEVYKYDENGNISAAIENNLEENFQYGAGNRLLNKGDLSFYYDANGRLIRKVKETVVNEKSKKEEWEFNWDALDQLRSVKTPDGEEWNYCYDPFGRRISKHSSKNHFHYVWDRNVIIHELENRTKLSTWIFDLHSFKPIAKQQNGSIYSVISDHIGTPRELIDSNGSIVWSAFHRSWGTIKQQKVEKIDCPIRFQGQWHDYETGLHYNRFRYYDPTVARFISQDPIGLRGGFNLYRYVPNPVNWIDPFGLDWNYVLTDSTGDVYYSGVASDNASQSAVEYRHGNNIGNDGQARFDADNGDRLIQVTPRGTDHETARGMEQRIADEFGTVHGRQGSEGNNVDGGSVRGNNQNPVDQNDSNAIKRDGRAQASQDFLDEKDTNTRSLVEDAIEGEEDSC